MYSTSRDTRLCISNNKVIIQQVVMEWNRKINEISTKMKKRVNHAHGMWITHLNFAVYVFYITQIQNQSEKRLVFIFYSLPLICRKTSLQSIGTRIYLKINANLPLTVILHQR